MLRLSFLAPDITLAILHGRQPANLNAHKLMADTRAPIDWHEQRAGLAQQILNLPQRQRIADVHHHREADHLRELLQLRKGLRI